MEIHVEWSYNLQYCHFCSEDDQQWAKQRLRGARCQWALWYPMSFSDKICQVAGGSAHLNRYARNRANVFSLMPPPKKRDIRKKINFSIPCLCLEMVKEMISRAGFNGYLNVWVTQPLMSRVICSVAGSQVPVYTKGRGFPAARGSFFPFFLSWWSPC